MMNAPPLARKRSLRRAIDGYCKWCIYDPETGGTWRQQVTLCPSNGCPLFPVRPLSQDADTLLDDTRRPNQQAELIDLGGAGHSE
mgnify:FL=1